ncbi:hypothetical protein DW949_08355 [Megasphaera sp. AM44-1BH]|uniref:phage baseplate protein n=1 Tax=Megasphaera sp. AM44-1BH TaxID=2292358 RepID=UPI000E48A612|nr:hypothetical protein [Megasphaera sp. AM44-1BH]RHA11757.1 hypothetical protein DW949_08355 [Megasphaera sp. AM44-1BH]
MATYNQFVVTDAGRALLAKAVANKGTFTVSSIKTSSHTYTQSAIAALTSLDDIRQSFPLASATTVDSTTIKLEFNVTNVGLSASYTLATLGVYATYNNSETLFAVSTANNPDVMNAEQAGALVRNILTTVYIKTSNASSISIAVAMDTYVTKAMLDAAETKALDRAHPIGSVYLNIGGTDPATAFGGTWKKIEGSYLLASGSYAGKTLTAGKTVGEEMHNITITEMPMHSHGGTTDTGGKHRHWTNGALPRDLQWDACEGNDNEPAIGYGDGCWRGHRVDGHTSSDGDHTHEFTTNDAGGGAGMLIMPLATVVDAWYRTA